jgi:hypothetical protein
VVHASVQHDHIHLLVEADDTAALAAGIKGLTLSISKRLNAALGRAGRVFPHRYHATLVTTPAEARAALVRVLNNWRRHDEPEASRRARVDPYSTAAAFDGWADPPASLGLPADHQPLPVARPTSWLLAIGWRRHGLIELDELPDPAPELGLE